MIARRQLLLAGGALALAPAALRAAPPPVPPGDRLAFDVLLKAKKMGTHVIGFTQAGDRLGVHVEVALAYRLLGITLYRYSHRCNESWEGDEMVAADSHTDDNGKLYAMSVRRGAGGLIVEGSDNLRYTAPASAVLSTHWNQRELDAPWINPQDGKLLHPRVAAAGSETIPAVGGRSLSARRFNLSGDVDMSIWYDRVGWAGIAFSRDGSAVRYERQG